MWLPVALCHVAPAACAQLMSSMPLKPEDVTYAPRTSLVNDRGV